MCNIYLIAIFSSLFGTLAFPQSFFPGARARIGSSPPPPTCFLARVVIK